MLMLIVMLMEMTKIYNDCYLIQMIQRQLETKTKKKKKKEKGKKPQTKDGKSSQICMENVKQQD